MEILKAGPTAILAGLFCLTLCRADEFAFHSLHAAKLGTLDCKLCHTPVSKGSVELKPPGPEECKLCHAASVYSAFKKRSGTLLIDFPHARHMDPKARVDSQTGFRADCVFCHKFTPQGATVRPTHTQCAVCHGKAGMKPELTPFLRTAGCRGCHDPEALDRLHVPVASVWDKIRFSHGPHFDARAGLKMDCITCHREVPSSTTLENARATLPTMVDCATCHQSSRKIVAAHRISNCSACHIDAAIVRTNFNRNVKPEFHTDAFRRHHEEMAAAPDAKCFACHQNALPSAREKQQCVSCHLIMEPASHTARWRDDIHGKYAAIDRESCATCHAADYCIRCHNELPASHVPLPLFKNGGHANLAMLNERSCMTCHTYQNTCASCHTRSMLQLGKPRPLHK